MLCELITQLKKLQKSAPESIDNTNSLDAFKTYLHVENEVERDLRTLLQNANTKQNKCLILVCGSAGDGKSHLVAYLKFSDPERLLDGYNPFHQAFAVCGNCSYCKRCPVRHNYEFLSNPAYCKKIIARIVEIVIKEKAIVSTREVLIDVLGDRDILQGLVKQAMDALSARSNVFERLVISKLEHSEDKPQNWTHYTPITTAVKSVFEQDFEYILLSEARTRDYLLPLLEFYYFAYTAQACLHLERLCDGNPASVTPIYFCLEWEKTSQSRQCYTKGWQRLERSVDKLFAHVITLEILNQIIGEGRYDYVKLARIAAGSPEDDAQLAGQIRVLSTLYRNAITDSREMKKVTLGTVSDKRTPVEIRFLFESVKAQFEDTPRRKNDRTYAEKFKKFCEKNFLKLRGRSGYMLSLSEEILIFLTKVCVKDQEILRLKDVFEEFERRGVFLDNVSKEQVTQYFEKLNLIEKKSDSGDAKYVKRIL